MLLAVEIFVGLWAISGGVRGTIPQGGKCCVMTCIDVEEDRCDSVLQILGKKTGIPPQRIYVNGDSISPPPAGRPDQVTKTFKRLFLTITNLLGTFQSFSDDVDNVITASAGDPSSLTDGDIQRIMNGLAHANEVYSQTRLDIEKENYECSESNSKHPKSDTDETTSAAMSERDLTEKATDTTKRATPGTTESVPLRYNSCHEIKESSVDAENGLYEIQDEKGATYMTYCDMEIDGGAWTLVASVHENSLSGKCTTGDRWSSEHGNNEVNPHGDGNWENANVFGEAENATRDDYKNPGYFNMNASDVMIWHVPNNASLDEFKDKAFMAYHTENGFLQRYGGSVYTLFKDYYPLRDDTYETLSGNGPSPPIVWDLGSNDVRIWNTPPHSRAETQPGYIQFRAINHERDAFALCPGLKPTGGHVEHVCIGGTSNHGESDRHCGDFSSFDWNGYGTGVGWSSNLNMTESVVMIFYR